jgi:hypothetical protein
MGVQAMVFTYLLGRTDQQGRTVIDIWVDSRSHSRIQSSLLSILGFIVVGHVVYLSVFAPHLVTKVTGRVDVGPSELLFDGVRNQPK